MLKPSLQLRIGQSLTMTPQLQQAIRLLQLPVMDLQATIQEALEGNVMLENVEEFVDVKADDKGSNSEEKSREEAVLDDAWREPKLTASSESNYNSGLPPISQDIEDTSGQSLHEYLLWQAEIVGCTTRERVIASAVIDAINDEGYLIDDFGTICATLGDEFACTEEELTKVLQIVQRFDPAGVGARNLCECLTLQLHQLDEDTPGLVTAYGITEDEDLLKLIADGEFSALRRKLNVSDDQIAEAVALVRSLYPKPGNAITPRSTDYVVPDVFVRKVDDKWIVEVNSALLPQLRVNNNYAGALRSEGDHSILRTQLQEARWLVRSLEIRNETLLKVARTIVDRQQEFLDKGEEAMTPMVLRDVAEAIEMHESTVSRVTTNKYMHTPRGVIELRYFFSSHVGSNDGGERSSIAIRAMIKKMIGNEDAAKPLSDNKIAQMLQEADINVARRTIAKYREAMNIPASSLRKRRTVK
ncbi:MAG: RNA polymerase factor sigma-54 [Gammaproteobacteria bacterium]|nr:RNA polymerase factor sigma-54 [Gammaproteobacteria bacterium]NNF67853.1 RNA polymerase factor sigma-54 [Gammaproteobacteria bacterium]